MNRFLTTPLKFFFYIPAFHLDHELLRSIFFDGLYKTYMDVICSALSIYRVKTIVTMGVAYFDRYLMVTLDLTLTLKVI